MGIGGSIKALAILNWYCAGVETALAQDVQEELKRKGERGGQLERRGNITKGQPLQ